VNTLLPTPTSRQQHPPQPIPAAAPAPRARRVGYLDRLALHVGVALIKWGRRGARADVSRERLVTLHEHRLLRESLERARENDPLQMMRLFR
jgi:hypothetical protein